MNKVLITGANGFIGKKLCSKLALCDRNIIKIVRKINLNDSSEQYKCDLGFDVLTDESFNEVDTIFHLAGLTHDRNDDSSNKKLYFDINVGATEQLALAAQKNGVKRFIYISSVKAGGFIDSEKCMTEDDQAEPDGIYGQSKRAAEIRLLEIGKKSKMRISIIRPALVYGPGVKGNLRNMMLGIKKGWFPTLPEIGNQRSMIHVDDLVDILLLVEKSEKSFSEIFIATDGNNYSSNEIYSEIRKSLNKGTSKWTVPNFVFVSIAKFGDIINTVVPFPFDSFKYQKLLGNECFSSDKIQSMLGFKARHSIFSDFSIISEGEEAI